MFDNKKVFNFDFVKYNKNILYLTLFLILFSILSICIKKFNFGLDFTGGIIFDINKNNIDNNLLKNKLINNNYKDIILQNYNEGLMIKISQKDILNKDKDIEKIKEIIKEINKDVIFNKIDFIGPQVGSILIKNGIMSLVLSFVGILFYIWYRFELEYGISAIITLLQNVVVLLGFISFFNLDFDLTTIAAILTILGYSVNDIVVLFDRIREHKILYKKEKNLSEIINSSININLKRTIYTGFSTLIAIFPLIFTTITSLKNFSIIIIFGIIFGTCSSIFTASQLLLFKKK